MRVGTFIEGVNDKVDWTLIREREHLFQALCQDIVTGLTLAFVVVQIKV